MQITFDDDDVDLYFGDVDLSGGDSSLMTFAPQCSQNLGMSHRSFRENFFATKKPRCVTFFWRKRPALKAGEQFVGRSPIEAKTLRLSKRRGLHQLDATSRCPSSMTAGYSLRLRLRRLNAVADEIHA